MGRRSRSRRARGGARQHERQSRPARVGGATVTELATAALYTDSTLETSATSFGPDCRLRPNFLARRRSASTSKATNGIAMGYIQQALVFRTSRALPRRLLRASLPLLRSPRSAAAAGGCKVPKRSAFKQDQLNRRSVRARKRTKPCSLATCRRYSTSFSRLERSSHSKTSSDAVRL